VSFFCKVERIASVNKLATIINSPRIEDPFNRSRLRSSMAEPAAMGPRRRSELHKIKLNKQYSGGQTYARNKAEPRTPPTLFVKARDAALTNLEGISCD
jgi:hypothetical protein